MLLQLSANERRGKGRTHELSRPFSTTTGIHALYGGFSQHIRFAACFTRCEITIRAFYAFPFCLIIAIIADLTGVRHFYLKLRESFKINFISGKGIQPFGNNPATSHCKIHFSGTYTGFRKRCAPKNAPHQLKDEFSHIAAR